MSKHGQPMSQTLAQMHLNELKMTDPKLNKMFDKLKKGDTVKIKHSSTLERGKDFIEYIVKSKNVVNKGRVEKITLATKDNPTAVKKFLYKRDGKVTFAVGDMGASIDDIKEKYSIINHEIIEDIEVEGLDEAIKYTHVAVDDDEKVIGMASKESDAKDMARRNKGKVVALKKPMSQKKGDMMINRPFQEETELDEMIPKSTMYALVKDGKVIAKGSKRDMMSKMKKEGGKVFNAPSKKVGDTIKEDGHDDVASAIRQCKTVTEDAMQILQKLQTMSPADTLPTWWTNKLAIASNSMNKIRDYLLVPSVTEGLELYEKAGDENDMKKLVGELQNASKLHLAQSKRVKAHVDMMKAGNLKGTLELVRIVDELQKASEAHLRQSKALANHMEKMNESVIKEQPEHEIQVGGYTTKHFHMCGSAQKVMKKHADKDGAEELTKLQDKFYEIEKMAMNAGKPTDEQISQTKTLYNQIMSKAKEMGIDDEVGGYMKMHMDSMEKGDPKLGFGRTDKDDGKEPIDEKYDLYHSTFSGAMQHAYDYAKKKLGITVDPKEIDSKVATGPRKPSEGKTNRYRLKGKGGNLQIQVYNKGGSKPFELNMYKEENEMNEKKKLKPGVKFDFRLFDPEDSPGSDKANDDMNKEIQKAVRMKDKETARQYMMKVQKKHSKHGATDTEPREVINQILDAIYEARERVNEGYESEVKKVLDKEGIDGYFKNGKLYVSKRDAKDAKKALEDSDEITKLPPMVKEENDMTKNLKETIMDMWKEAVSPAQQAAIAISKKEKEKEEGNAFTGALKAAKEKGEKTFTVAGKEYDVKTEKLVGGQKKLDKDKDGDIDAKDFAMLRKQKKTEDVEHERQRYLETKKGSVRESILKMWGEISEKVEYVEYKFKSKNDAMAVKKMLDGMQMMSFDVNDDNISNGELMVDAGNRDMTKVHKDIMKKYRPKVMTQEKKDLTKNEKHDSVKKTDTGKEMSPVDMSPKMPKVKESKNKV